VQEGQPYAGARGNALVLARSLGVLVEVTNLIIPTLNDSDDMLLALCRWIRENMGRETPLHFSRFFPQYKMQHLPATPPATLRRARDIAKSVGLHYVYIGNILETGAAGSVSISGSSTSIRGACKASTGTTVVFAPFECPPDDTTGEFYALFVTAAGDVHVTQIVDIV